jgi:uncharacterized protein (DUF1330 family)
MSAYFIVDIDIHDAAGLEEYRKQVPATITKYGGASSSGGARSNSSKGSGSRSVSSCWSFPASNRPGDGTTPRSTVR